jgi:fluoride ion exporter CrcB/FEX
MEATTQSTPESAEATATKPNGPVAAVLLASGIGAFVIGLLTTLAEASESFAESIQYDDGVGPLSGKTLWASAAFFVSWGALAYLLRDRELPWKPLLITAAVLIGLGLLGTFPIFFQAFAPE